MEPALLLANEKPKRIRRTNQSRGPKLEKALIALFAECRAAGLVVRQRRFERKSKTVFFGLYGFLKAGFADFTHGMRLHCG